MSDPLEQKLEVVADGGEKRVDGIALLSGEIVAVHAMLVLEMPDDGLDG